jgi:3-hydroxybutyryl-CoA dehydrogenase
LNPADETLVVEVAGGTLSSDEAIDAGCRFVESLGKHPIRVQRDVKGYIWNRLQFAMLRECLHLLESGVADAADIDLAVTAGLAPRWLAAGPLATADLGGLQTFASISDQLFPVLDARTEGSELLRARASEGGSLRRWDQGQVARVIERRTEALAFAARLHSTSRDN